MLENLKQIYGSEVESLLPKARELDRHYIPSRYPNAFESGYPGQYYDEETSSRSIEYGEVITWWVKERLKEIGLDL